MVRAAVGELRFAEILLGFDLAGFGGARGDHGGIVSVFEVGRVLVAGGGPAVADEEAFEGPGLAGAGLLADINLTLFVTVDDRRGDVGDVLASVGFAGNINLHGVTISLGLDLRNRGHQGGHTSS